MYMSLRMCRNYESNGKGLYKKMERYARWNAKKPKQLGQEWITRVIKEVQIAICNCFVF